MASYWRDFSNLDRCDECPIYKAGFCPGNSYSFTGGAPLEPPCCEFDDNVNMDAVAWELYRSRERYLESKARQEEKERIRRERALKAADTRAQVRYYC